METHTVGSRWHPIKDDRRYTVTLEWVGYSVPLYCVRFCDKVLASCLSLNRAEHAAQTLKAERDMLLTVD